MYERILWQMCECIRTREYVMMIHAEEEMSADALTIFDVERGILTGHIMERQQDRVTNEWKYLIEGQALAGEWVIL